MRRLIFLPVLAVLLMGATTVSQNLTVAVTQQAPPGACPMGNAYPDGCSGAPTPAGAIEYPNLLAQYGANRSPWNVAGVDYYVGMPAGLTLADWRTLQNNSNWQFSNGTLRCQSGSPVLNGYDFTTGSAGWSIYVPTEGCSSLTIESSKIGCVPGAGTGQNAPAFGGFNIQVGSSYKFTFIFKNNTVDYANCQGTGGPSFGLIAYGNTGCNACTTDVEYNYIHDLWADPAIFGGNQTSFIWRYNLIVNPGTSDPVDGTNIHMNALSWAGGSASNATVTYNTIFVNQSYTGGELPQMYFNGGGTFTSPTLSNNTFPLNSCGCVSYIMHGSTGYTGPATTVTSGSVSNNYIDPTDTYGAFYGGSFTSADGWSASGNINMTTGATITPK